MAHRTSLEIGQTGYVKRKQVLMGMSEGKRAPHFIFVEPRLVQLAEAVPGMLQIGRETAYGRNDGYPMLVPHPSERLVIKRLISIVKAKQRGLIRLDSVIIAPRQLGKEPFRTVPEFYFE